MERVFLERRFENVPLQIVTFVCFLVISLDPLRVTYYPTSDGSFPVQIAMQSDEAPAVPKPGCEAPNRDP